jgi:hypothetical protein
VQGSTVLEVTHGLKNLLDLGRGLVFQILLALALHLSDSFLVDLLAHGPVNLAASDVVVRRGHCV